MITTHPQFRLITLVSAVIMLAWALLLILIGLPLACGSGNCSSLADDIFLYSAWSLVFTVILVLAPAGSIKCPNCGEQMLKQTHKPKDEKAVRYVGLDYWSSAVIDCMAKKEITCMYCGTTFSCKKADPGQRG